MNDTDRQLEAARHSHRDREDAVASALAKAHAAEAEAQRLREALEAIANPPRRRSLWSAVWIARAALEGRR